MNSGVSRTHTVKRRRTEKQFLPWWRRALAGGALGAAILGAPWVLLLLVLAIGGRYQVARSTEYDLLLLAAVYPLGPALAGVVLGAVQPVLWRPWVAVLAGIVVVIPWFAAMSLALDPHGRHPYEIEWPLTIICSLCFGPLAGTYGHDFLPPRGAD
jgi:hypothetical protein